MDKRPLSLLDDPCFFRCEHFRTVMLRVRCIARQRGEGRRQQAGAFSVFDHQSFDHCESCEQGKKIMEEYEMKEEQVLPEAFGPKPGTDIPELVMCTECGQNPAMVHKKGLLAGRPVNGKCGSCQAKILSASRERAKQTRDSSPPEERRCTRCGKVKPLDEFHRSSAGKYGRKPQCIDCCANARLDRIKSRQESPAPPAKGHPRFHELLTEMASLHDRKNNDYGGGNLLGNFLEVAKLGIPPWKGALVRLTDKYSRALNLASGVAPQVRDETLKDTLIDLANYAILSIVLMEEAGIKEGGKR